MVHLRKLAICLIVGILASSTVAAQERQIVVGGDGPDFDACGSLGVVANLNPKGDDFLSVRSGPSSIKIELDRLKSGQPVDMCQQIGRWVGIVYPPIEDPDFDCKTSSPVPHPQKYQGPCRSGWVFDKYIQLTAG